MSGTDQDRTEIRRLFDGLNAAWGRADAEAFGAAFTEDADYVTFVGTHYRGRAKIVEMHAALWAKFLKGSRLLGGISDIRFVTPDAAVVVSVGRVLRWRFSRSRPDKAQTFVAVRGAGGWRFAAFHNCKRHPFFEMVSSRSDARLAPNTEPVPAVLAG
jgi:uncharacterized protein (TIGR02246 family)